jgi:DNA (cytosine-5)-methyltransferase 1
MIPVHLLDLFCGAGGASMGYARAGFVVTGVDRAPQRHYPFRFIKGDVFDILDRIDLSRFDAIHASPPCQRFTRNARQRGTAENHPDLIAPTRERLRAIGKPYIIENVELAPLIRPILLCGVMFGLGVFRHRLFETSWPHNLRTLVDPPHPGHIGDGRFYTVAGHTGYNSTRDGRVGGTAEDWRRAMDIKWMNCYELAEAIPPAYTHFIGENLMTHLRRRVIRGAA